MGDGAGHGGKQPLRVAWPALVGQPATQTDAGAEHDQGGEERVVSPVFDGVRLSGEKVVGFRVIVGSRANRR